MGMKKHPLLVVLCAIIVAAATAIAASYSYKCPKCGLIQQYDHQGVYKCPNDGWMMSPSN
jgi:predicted RNA-binding Zn-ribbon protein involved in translation (DUF1610 family)